MQTENRFIDDIVKMMNGAAGTLAGVGREAESSARSRAREWIGGLDFVSRDEFEVVKAMAVAARDENDALRARIDALEAKAAAPAATPSPSVMPSAAPTQSQSQGFGATGVDHPPVLPS